MGRQPPSLVRHGRGLTRFHCARFGASLSNMQRHLEQQCRRMRHVAVLGAALALAGCSEGPISQGIALRELCDRPFPDYWGRARAVGVYFLVKPDTNIVSISASDEILWNHNPVTVSTLDSYLLGAANLDPRPFVLFNYQKGAKCTQIVLVRDRIEALYQCSESAGKCRIG